MEQFIYHFITTMFHSIWQSALLLAVYFLVICVNPKSSPLYKRNILLGFSGAQLLLSLVTFFMISSAPSLSFLMHVLPVVQPNNINSFIQNNALLISFVYCSMVLLRLSKFFISWNRFKRNFTQSLLKPSLDLRLFTQSKAHQFGITKKVAVWYSNNISTPMTFGFFKPIVLLPFALVNQLTLQQTEALIIHELTHISHHDYLLNWLLLITESLYFFNPFMLIIAQKIKTERELNCDVQVLQFNYAPILYAETLLKTAQYQQQHLSLQLAAVKCKKQLLQRIHFFSNNQRLEFTSGNGYIPTLCAAVVLCISLIIPGLSTKKNPVFQSAAQPFTVAKRGSTTSEAFTVSTLATPPSSIRSSDVVIARNNSSKNKQATKKVDDTPTDYFTGTAAPEEEFYAIPVNYMESLVEGKEITITEENSDGKKITAVYNAILVDGIWTLQPLYLIKLTRNGVPDSTKIIKDTLVTIVPAVQ